VPVDELCVLAVDELDEVEDDSDDAESAALVLAEELSDELVVVVVVVLIVDDDAEDVDEAPLVLLAEEELGEVVDAVVLCAVDDVADVAILDEEVDGAEYDTATTLESGLKIYPTAVLLLVAALRTTPIRPVERAVVLAKDSGLAVLSQQFPAPSPRLAPLTYENPVQPAYASQKAKQSLHELEAAGWLAGVPPDPPPHMYR